jgi:hypothetical protein
MPNPPQFPKVVVHDLALMPGLTGVCAGYELGEWRCKQLASHVLTALPEFCLTYSECESLDSSTAVQLLREAALRVYQSEKFKNRGEFGELLLHVLLRQVFRTVPAISKIYFKDSANDTVKGFDAVHVIVSGSTLELWLGEAKFYSDIDAAIRDVAEGLAKHSDATYLRNEFIAIKSKIDPKWPHADRLRELLHPNTSLDDVFSAICVPVLLTYDGDATGRHSAETPDYTRELENEFFAIYGKFASSGLPANLKLHLFLLPMKTKQTLLDALDEGLRSWQKI